MGSPQHEGRKQWPKQEQQSTTREPQQARPAVQQLVAQRQLGQREMQEKGWPVVRQQVPLVQPAPT